jgi:hypothetical protein
MWRKSSLYTDWFLALIYTESVLRPIPVEFEAKSKMCFTCFDDLASSRMLNIENSMPAFSRM